MAPGALSERAAAIGATETLAAQQIIVTVLASERVRIPGALEEPATVCPPPAPAPGEALSPVFQADSAHDPTVLAALEGVEKPQAIARHPIDHMPFYARARTGSGCGIGFATHPNARMRFERRRLRAPTHTRQRDAQRLGGERAVHEESHGRQAPNRSPWRRARSAGSSMSQTVSSHETSRPIARSRVTASTWLVPQGTSSKGVRQGALNPTSP